MDTGNAVYVLLFGLNQKWLDPKFLIIKSGEAGRFVKWSAGTSEMEVFYVLA